MVSKRTGRPVGRPCKASLPTLKKFRAGRPDKPFLEDPDRLLVALHIALTSTGGFGSSRKAAQAIAAERFGNFLCERRICELARVEFGTRNNPADGKKPSDTFGQGVPYSTRNAGDVIRRKRRFAERDPANREWLGFISAAIRILMDYEQRGASVENLSIRIGRKLFVEKSHRRLAALIVRAAGEEQYLKEIFEPRFDEIEQARESGQRSIYTRVTR
jgi:hypothetical protein